MIISVRDFSGCLESSSAKHSSPKHSSRELGFLNMAGDYKGEHNCTYGQFLESLHQDIHPPLLIR